MMSPEKKILTIIITGKRTTINPEKFGIGTYFIRVGMMVKRVVCN